MRAGRFVGRVGGLAVALGVGVAVASSPGVAWAEDGSSPGADSVSPSTAPGGTAGAAGAAGTRGTSESQGSSTTIGTTAETAGTSTVAGLHNGASTPGSDSVDASESGTSASGGASVRQVPPGMAISTGGADPSTKSNSETSAIGDGAVELTTDDSALPELVADSTASGPEAPGAAMTVPVGGPRGGSNTAAAGRRPDRCAGRGRQHADSDGERGTVAVRSLTTAPHRRECRDATCRATARHGGQRQDVPTGTGYFRCSSYLGCPHRADRAP